MMKKYSHILGIVGLIIAVYGVVSAILYSNTTWYSYFIIGAAIFLAWINQILKNNSILEKNKNYLLKTFGIYLLFGILIEIIGRFTLSLWSYPSFSFWEEIIHVFLISYPFAFFFILESIRLIQKKIHSLTLTIVLATPLHAFINEIPNTFAHEWVYKIPYISFEILQINIIVIIGWVILISIPLITKRILSSKI